MSDQLYYLWCNCWCPKNINIHSHEGFQRVEVIKCFPTVPQLPTYEHLSSMLWAGITYSLTFPLCGHGNKQTRLPTRVIGLVIVRTRCWIILVLMQPEKKIYIIRKTKDFKAFSLMFYDTIPQLLSLVWLWLQIFLVQNYLYAAISFQECFCTRAAYAQAEALPWKESRRAFGFIPSSLGVIFTSERGILNLGWGEV